MKRLLIAATALSLLSCGAYAQVSSNSGSNASAVNSSSSVSSPSVSVIGNPIGNGASSSYSNAGASAYTHSNSSSSATGNRSSQRTINNITVSTGTSGSGTGASALGATDPSGSGSGSGSNDPVIHYEGGYTVRNTPEVMPPSVVGGNTCAIGVSGGLALPGFGIAGGATWADKACERRQEAALLYNMGEHQVAYALMCQDDHVRQAMREVGKPCLQDRPVAAAPARAVAAAPPVAAAPVAAAAPPAPAAPAPTHVATAATPKQPKPAWCTPATVSPEHLKTLSEGQRYYVRMHCGT